MPFGILLECRKSLFSAPLSRKLSRFRNYSGSRVKPLSFRGCGLPVATSKRMLRSTDRGGSRDGVVGLQFFSFYHTCLSIGEATLERLWVEALIPTIQRGNRNPPLKANLSALSFRHTKIGRARRGMSDKVKIIYNLIDVLNCNQHSYNPSVFLLRKNPPPLQAGEVGGSTNLRPWSEGGKI